jgi:4-amino-4-deoxy-L-arabinose transferase-like glycosyltransferase
MSDNLRYMRFAWWSIGAILLIRIIFVVIFPFDLSGDEAYYWDWGRQLDWGYFSKPPGIAWLMALANWLGGGTDTGIRLMAVALGTGTLCSIYFLTRHIFGHKAAFWAVLITAASPGNVALNLILTIDAPLMFFWTGSLLLFYNYVHRRDYKTVFVFANTFLLGFGLLSKQMMFAFYPIAIAYLAMNGELRHFLRDWRLWVSWGISLAFLVPTLIWNAQNDWITVSHTQHHFEGKPITFMEILSRIGEFYGSQLGVLSPVTAVALLILGIGVIKRYRSMDLKVQFLALFSLPGLILVSIMLLRQSINPNWPAVFYPTLTIMLAGAVCESSRFPEAWGSYWKKWKPSILIVGMGFAVLSMALGFILEWLGQTGSKNLDPLVRLQGWSELADDVQKVREYYNSEHDSPILIATGHRYTTSHLAFNLVDQPRVYRWPQQPGMIESQYELWKFPPEVQGKDALIVVPGEDAPIPDSLAEQFESWEKVEAIEVTRSAKRTRYFTLYIGKSLELSSEFINTTR